MGGHNLSQSMHPLSGGTERPSIMPGFIIANVTHITYMDIKMTNYELVNKIRSEKIPGSTAGGSGNL